jgi:hypothetical protein
MNKISDTAFPEFARILERYKFTQRRPDEDPDEFISNIESIRICTTLFNGGFLIYPEYCTKRRKWHKFYYQKQSLLSYCPNLRIAGFDRNLAKDRIQQIGLAWREWLRRWIKENKLRIEFYVEPLEEQSEPEREPKRERRNNLSLTQRIREAEGVRIVPISGSHKVRIQIKTPGGWITVKETELSIAEGLLLQAKNRVILG